MSKTEQIKLLNRVKFLEGKVSELEKRDKNLIETNRATLVVLGKIIKKMDLKLGNIEDEYDYLLKHVKGAIDSELGDV